MRRNNSILALCAASSVFMALPAKAQVVLDMSLVTCKQFLDGEPDHQNFVASWMSGYFSATKNLHVIDFRYVTRNQQKVVAYCKKRGSETLMSAIQKNAK